MKKISIMILLILIVLVTNTIYAGSDCDSDKTSHSTSMRVALYSAPSMTKKDIGLLAQSFSKESAIQSAKPDLEKKEISVTYDTNKIKEEEIRKLIHKVMENAKLLKIGATESNDSKVGCGKCPNKNKCASTKKS